MKLQLCTLYLRLMDKKAQAMSEYALILALIAVIAVVTVTLLGTTLRTTFQNIVDSFGS
ncbi:MAG: Flp family type IVb pilin [Candidatus Peregrinibacteria bacterium]|nr:Flp family type IVb pilin [Candidatus Peregrinibacteria bacterium]MDZ4244371.1 Flp family type IVb pilin [Candidatus Gracilibacteria bacterium]